MMSCTDMRYVDPVHRCALQAEVGGGGGGGRSTASGVAYCR